MAKRSNPQNVIESYKRKQQMTPYVIGGLAALLVIAGVIILVMALSPGGVAAPKPTDTATAVPATLTPEMPTATTQAPPTVTVTPTVTSTPTATITNTPAGPFEYTVLEKDNCWDIALKFKVDLNTMLALNNFPAGQCPISPGQKIMIPAPGQTLPTATPVDVSKLAPGVLLDYIVQPGDTLKDIAIRYRSTQAAIMAQNKMTDPNVLVAGQKLVIPVNIATPVPTTTDTPTPKPVTVTPTGGAATAAATATVTRPAATPTK